MHLQIGDDLRTTHNDQLVYSNHQDIVQTLFTGFKIWLVLKLLQLCYCTMPAHYLIWLKFVSWRIINLRSIPGRWHPLKKQTPFKSKLETGFNLFCVLSKTKADVTVSCQKIKFLFFNFDWKRFCQGIYSFSKKSK